ncbi:hypothetical protein T265_15177, partial [Opisthorchis viverrini]
MMYLRNLRFQRNISPQISKVCATLCCCSSTPSDALVNKPGRFSRCHQ